MGVIFPWLKRLKDICCTPVVISFQCIALCAAIDSIQYQQSAKNCTLLTLSVLAGSCGGQGIKKRRHRCSAALESNISTDLPNEALGELSEGLEGPVQAIYLLSLLGFLVVGAYLVVRQVLIRRELEDAAKVLGDRIRSGSASSEVSSATEGK